MDKNAAQRKTPQVDQLSLSVAQWVLAVQDVSVGSRFVTYLSADGQTPVKERVYRIIDGTSAERTVETTTASPVLTQQEYVAMLAGIGFQIEVFGGYNERACTAESRTLCFVCRKPAETYEQ